MGLTRRLAHLRTELVEAVLDAPARNSETVESLIEKGRAARQAAAPETRS
jgi:hypothetical protein